MGIFAQTGHDIRLEWGTDGIEALGRECAVLIVVDVLSFSTTVDLVLGRGGRVLPLCWRDERAATAAQAAGAVLAGEREWTLRPSSVTAIPAGTFLGLPSPNGATLCVTAARTGAQVLAGCLRNAAAVAAAAVALADGGPIGVLPGGERWGVSIPGDGTGSGALRPCVEDQLGAGAIIDALLLAGAGRPSVEAALAVDAYRATGSYLGAAVADSVSGRELIENGHPRDVELALAVNSSATVPRLVDGVLEALA
ncbi:2-phosphosulfolactate phosphatase [Amycolatopsis nigrescens]|uniref:2-phosphosulfolactate phosphatase n=1 Tax=Amycolatopsis nigrescens TaxID=381445 RepID=UPI0003A72A49|nr:2-phosphosulfolactate phosphatase [Amycolatopsis nigrescens]